MKGPIPRRGIDTSLGQAGYCGRCHMWMPDGPDICLGYIPGVSHACCGHGNVSNAYAVLGGEPDQNVAKVPLTVTLDGNDALRFFKLVRRGRWGHKKSTADGGSK